MNRKSNNQGGALLIAMVVVLIFAGLVTVGQMLSSSQILLTTRSADVDSMQTTAEGLVDFAYGAWENGMKNSTTLLTTQQATALVTGANAPALPSWMQVQSFTITALDAQGNDIATPVAVPTLSQQPKGWQSNSYQYAARVTLIANPSARFPKKVTMESIMRHDLVPPVGGLFFCEGDFELYKPAPMIIGGNVFTNSNGYVTTHATTLTDKLRFLATSNISYVGSYQHAVAPYGALWSPVSSPTDVQAPIYDRGYDSQVSKSDRLESIGMGTSTAFSTTDTNPNNDGNHELIEPPVSTFTDPPGIASSRIYNNAGLVIEVAGPITGAVSTTNPSIGVYTGNNVTITAKNGTSLTTAKANAIIAALSNSMTVTTSSQVYNATKKVWQTVTTTTTVQKTVYDKREGAEVLVSDVDLGALNTTLNGLTGFNNIIYMNNTAATTGPAAIRVDNGGVLPTNGLTLATQGGLYVIGDYNTGTTTDPTVVPSNVAGNPDGTSQNYKTGYSTKPAALVADAVMFLSNGWSDSNDSNSLSSRIASHTTVNTAVIAGYIPSGWVNPATSETYWYSGGANNFPRFLENWGGKGMTFSGAFVSLFKSQMFTGMWDTADIYGAPNRRWSFDSLLLSRVIPGIPPASAFSRGQVRPL
jgi:hypothetical protein